MEFVVIPVVALLASLLTFFSGFGLGTILLPAFALFFPVDIAVALTAIVHLLNNIFKLALVGRYIDKGVVVRFGLIAIPASLLGAWLLSGLAGLAPLASYRLFNLSLEIAPIKLTVAVLMALFAVWEVVPRLREIAFGRRYLPVGGVLSGFFGGLSGHQGALRSAFLSRSGLTTEGFIATTVVVAILVDIPRVSVYVARFSLLGVDRNVLLLAAAAVAAFLGAFLGSLWIKKVTMRGVRVLVAVMLFSVALALGSGLI
jgi:uncharacterized membrane protein YfcA